MEPTIAIRKDCKRLLTDNQPITCSRLPTLMFMWKDLPEPEGPRQKKFELSVSLFIPSFPLMSMATGTP